MPTLLPCTAPTFFFIGVSTARSSIMQLFPRWMELLNLEAIIRGVDVPLHAPAATYRRIVAFLRDDPLARGALITSHKLDLYRAAAELLAAVDELAQLCGEVSCLAKRGEDLYGYAKDPISAGLALADFVPPGHFGKRDAAGRGPCVLCFGAGGAAVAISLHLARLPAAERPQQMTFVDVRPDRLEHIRELHARLDDDVRFAYRRHRRPHENDQLLAEQPPGSLVINATGMGKDRPGSPITREARFPEGAFVWELNYRGELDFYHQARAQQQARGLHVEDGWRYFLHGWTQAIAEVFELELDAATFARLEQAAAPLRE